MGQNGKIWEKNPTFDSNLKSQKTLINLIGTYDCKADAKGRLMISSAFKKQLASVLQDGFVIKKATFQRCLELYPMQEWNTTTLKINKLNRLKKKNNDFIRTFNAGAKVVEVDAFGRLLIPKDLCDYANIRKEVVLSSAINIIEIWNKNNYEKVIDEATSDFASLAEEVMGGSNGDELS